MGRAECEPRLGVCTWHGQAGRFLEFLETFPERELDIFPPPYLEFLPITTACEQLQGNAQHPPIWPMQMWGALWRDTPPSSCPHDPLKDRLAGSYQPFPLYLQNRMLVLPFHPYCPSEHETKITTAVSCLKWKWQHFFFRKVFYHLPFHQWHRDSENQLMQSSQISTNPTDAGNLWQKNFIPWRKLPNS